MRKSQPIDPRRFVRYNDRMENERVCVIVGGGPFRKEDFVVEDDEYLVAADAGYRSAVDLRMPDAAIGDFDSLGFVPETITVLRHPVRKDDTDTHLAIATMYERGFRKFRLYGVLGGRLDHTLATIQTCTYFARRGCDIRIVAEDQTLYFVTRELELPRRKSHFLSVFAMGRAEGVSESGVAYPLDDATLTDEFPLGISNEIVAPSARICVRSGVLLVMEQKRDDL